MIYMYNIVKMFISMLYATVTSYVDRLRKSIISSIVPCSSSLYRVQLYARVTDENTLFSVCQFNSKKQPGKKRTAPNLVAYFHALLSQLISCWIDSLGRNFKQQLPHSVQGRPMMMMNRQRIQCDLHSFIKKYNMSSTRVVCNMYTRP